MGDGMNLYNSFFKMLLILVISLISIDKQKNYEKKIEYLVHLTNALAASGASEGSSPSAFHAKPSSNFEGIYQSLLASMKTAKSGCSIISSNVSLLLSEINRIEYGPATSCGQGYSNAATTCLEKWSPRAPVIASQIHAVTNTIGMMSTSNACSELTKGINKVNTLLTGWQTACASMRGVCMTRCSSGLKEMDAFITKANNLVTTIDEAIGAGICTGVTSNCVVASCNSVKTNMTTTVIKLASDEKAIKLASNPKANVDFSQMSTIGDREESCARFSDQIANIGMSMMNNYLMKQASDKCNQQSSAGALDCNLPENQENPTCICKNNPRNAACAKTLAAGVALAAGGNDVHTQKSTGSGAAPGGGSSGFDGPSGSLDGNSLPGAPMGGGGSGLGGSAGGGGGANADGGAAQKRLNANIYNGFEGGSGGGSARLSFANSSESDTEAATRLRKYMPAQKGEAAVGQSLFDTAQVTGKGKSNWEKIRQRYNDNRQNLINK